MKKPIIGVSGSLIIDSSGNFAGYKRSYVNNDYILSVIKNGGVPFIIPFNENEEVTRVQMDMVDGLLLSGGQDVAPRNYGEEPTPKLGDIFPERDDFEYGLLKAALEAKKPVLGICRGVQIIN
ncbi:MAG: gamma-glutamyl-gamma-aminobutyrate hydrolase family protein, partial [Catonella sp.]